MKFVDVVVLLYAILLIVFGILGFVIDHSIPSIAAGTLFGALLLGSLALYKTNPRLSRISSAVISLLPLGRFLPAFIQKGHWYPAGIVVAAGTFTFATLMIGHFMAMAKKKKEA